MLLLTFLPKITSLIRAMDTTEAIEYLPFVFSSHKTDSDNGNMEKVFKSCISQVLWCDVHLICAGKLFKAHKTVLSSVSPFLREILLAQPNEESPTTIVLSEFSLEAFSALLQYVYNGEVMIRDELILDFINILNALAISLSLQDHKRIQCKLEENESKYHIDTFDINKNETYPQVTGERLRIETNVDFENELIGDTLYKKDDAVEFKTEVGISNDYIHSNNQRRYNRLCQKSCCNLRFNKTIDRTSFPVQTSNLIEPITSPYQTNRYSNMPSYDLRTKSSRDRREVINSSISRYDGIIKPTAIRPLPTLLPITDNNFIDSGQSLDLSLKTSTSLQKTSKEVQRIIPGPWFSKPPLAFKPVKPKSILIEEKKLSIDETPNEELSSPTAESAQQQTLNDRNNNQEEDAESENPKHPNHTCAECGKQFSQLRNYKYHLSVHKGTKEFAATCPVCGKHFNDRGYLSSHLKIHRNRKEYQCPNCPKSFNQRVAYNMHVRIHTGIKPHICDECGKAFSRKMLLKQHLRTHSGEKPYSCTVCEKKFADRSNMTLHMRLHSGVKPFACDLCPKTFTKKHHLKTHLNYHTGHKPYSCPKCLLAFSQSSNMRTHLKKCTERHDIK